MDSEENLDEVSNATLRSYITKSAITKRIGKREKSFRLAVNKLNKGPDARVHGTSTFKEETVDEAIRQVGSYDSTDKKKTAKVYRDTEWNEYRVKFHTGGKHHKDADYHTDDEDDAHGTAKHWVGLKEDLNEVYVAAFHHTDANGNIRHFKIWKNGDKIGYDHHTDDGVSLGAGFIDPNGSHDDARKSVDATIDHYKKGGASAAKKYLEKISGHKWHIQEEVINEIGNTGRGQLALRSYVQKAARSYVKHDDKSDELSDAATKYFAAKDKNRGKAAAKAAGDHAWTAASRMIGMYRAGKRIKEEMEDIHEIGDTERGRKALASYMDKARSQGTYGLHQAGVKLTDQNGPKAFKRDIGGFRAKDRIDDHTPLQRTPKIHDVSHMDDGEVYDHTQTSDKIKDGDVLHMSGGRTAILFKAWPTMVHGDSDALHQFGDRGAPPSHAKSVQVAKNIAGIIAAKERNGKGVREEVEEIDETRTYRRDRDTYYAGVKRANLVRALNRSSDAAKARRAQKERTLKYAMESLEDARLNSDGTTNDTIVKDDKYNEALKAYGDKLRHNFLMRWKAAKIDD